MFVKKSPELNVMNLLYCCVSEKHVINITSSNAFIFSRSQRVADDTKLTKQSDVQTFSLKASAIDKLNIQTQYNNR